MMQFTLKHVPEVLRLFRSFPERFIPAVQRGMEKGMHVFNGQIAREQMSGRPGLKRQGGTLARASRVVTRGWGRSFVVQGQFGYPSAPYVKVHQDGGPFTSRGKLFSIPLTREARGKWPRDWGKGLFFVKSRRGNLLLMDKTSRSPQYVLKRTINIPKRLHIPEQFRATGYDTLLVSVAREVAKEGQRQLMRY